jgi:probable rRNA maturation factor
VKAVLGAHGVQRAKIGLRLVSDEEMASMNQKHLHHEGPTDVLTFDLRDEDTDCGLEGEIALSVETARREGESIGHGVEAELALYAVHGVLHLLDYRDDAKDVAASMHAMEDRILGSLGLGAVYASSRR